MISLACRYPDPGIFTLINDKVYSRITIHGEIFAMKGDTLAVKPSCWVGMAITVC